NRCSDARERREHHRPREQEEASNYNESPHPVLDRESPPVVARERRQRSVEGCAPPHGPAPAHESAGRNEETAKDEEQFEAASNLTHGALPRRERHAP